MNCHSSLSIFSALTRGLLPLFSQVGGRFRQFRCSAQEAQSKEEEEKQEQRQVRKWAWEQKKVLTSKNSQSDSFLFVLSAALRVPPRLLDERRRNQKRRKRNGILLRCSYLNPFYSSFFPFNIGYSLPINVLFQWCIRRRGRRQVGVFEYLSCLLSS